jgi:predicted porin
MRLKMVSTRPTIIETRQAGLRIAGLAFCAVLASSLAAGSAVAAPQKETVAVDDHYQVYIGNRVGGAYPSHDWGKVRLTPPNGGGSGLTYFTPSVSGVRVGVGFAAPSQADGDAAQYTDLGPRTAQGREAAGKRQIGGAVAYSGLEVGANIGDHSDPSCTGGGCKTNDFWDVGVALRIGSGAISAGYTASQPRGTHQDEVDRIDVYSLNAGYKLTPGMDIYGGVDWVDTRTQSEAAETPVDTRFMLGTNLRF